MMPMMRREQEAVILPHGGTHGKDAQPTESNESRPGLSGKPRAALSSRVGHVREDDNRALIKRCARALVPVCTNPPRQPVVMPLSCRAVGKLAARKARYVKKAARAIDHRRSISGQNGAAGGRPGFGLRQTLGGTGEGEAEARDYCQPGDGYRNHLDGVIDESERQRWPFGESGKG